MQQKLFQIFLPQEAESFGNNIQKETTKATPKIEKICMYIATYLWRIFALPTIQCKW